MKTVTACDDPATMAAGRSSSVDPGTLFPSLTLGKYRLNFKVRGENRLKGNSGSPWRGELGHELQEKFCPWASGRDCNTCSVSNGCTYYLLFEQAGSGNPFSTPPRPYIVRQSRKTSGELQVEITLIGLSDEHVLRVLSVFQGLEKIGMYANRTSIRVDTIWQFTPGMKWQCIFQDNMSQNFFHTSWLLKDYLDNEKTPKPPWSIRFISPLRLKYKDKILSNIPWDWAFCRFARRLSLLEDPETATKPESLPWSTLNEFFNDYGKIISVNYWHDLHRYSSTQRSKIPAGGLKGVCLVTPPEGTEWQWHRWWRTASLLHIGGKTTIGNGCLEFNNTTGGEKCLHHHRQGH